MAKTARYVNVFLPAVGLRADEARSRWRTLLGVARRLGFAGVRVDAEFFRYARHPEPQITPYTPEAKIAPMARLVGESGLKLLVVLGYNPWRNSWSQWAGFNGSNQEIDDWYNRVGGGETNAYALWLREKWPNERRTPRALWPAMKRAYQSMIDDLVREWQRTRRLIGDIEFSWWQEPDGAGGHDHRTGAQADWDSDFHAFCGAMLTGSGALDFHEVRCWSPAFTSGWQPTAAKIRVQAELRQAYWSRFGALAFNCYRVDLPSQPEKWVEAVLERARNEADAFRSRSSFFGSKPLGIHEFGLNAADVGRTAPDDEMGRMLAEVEQKLIALELFDMISLYSLNEDQPSTDPNPRARYAFASSLPSQRWYRRLRGYASAWGVQGFDNAPEGHWAD